MKVIRIEDLYSRYETLKEEISMISKERFDQVKSSQENEKLHINQLSIELKRYSNQVTELARKSDVIAQDLSYSKQYCELYDQYILTSKELTLSLNEKVQLIYDLYLKIDKQRSELNQKELNMYDHQHKLLIHVLNDYSNNLISQNESNKEVIHNLIDNFGSFSFYNLLLEIER